MSTALRDYQQRGIDDLCDLYGSGHRRATLVLPCGTGKTVVAGHLITRLEANRVVVFVPTVQLLSQTLERLAVDNPLADVLAVCSSVALDVDDLPESVTASATGEQVTTDPDVVADTIRSARGRLIVVATYASSPVVAQATAGAGLTWDLLIADEAHRTAGPVGKAWALPLSEDHLPARRRLFMTATTRIVSIDEKTVPDGMDSDDIEVVSMDSVGDYGPHVEPLTFRAAIDAHFLSDYEIAVVAVSHDEVLQVLQQARIGGEPADVSSAAAQLALMHTAASRPDLRTVLAFHNRIDQSRNWVAQLRRLASLSDPGIVVQAFHVDGSTAPAWRTRAINALTNPDGHLTVVSNCRVFAEGVDVPALDAVAIAAPRTSGPEIVQIVGRAIRPHPDGHERKALIILPVLDHDGDPTDIDTKVARTGHLAAWQVLTALAEQDELLHESLVQWREHIDHGSPTPVGSRIRIDMSMLAVGAHLPFTLRTIARASSPHVLTASKLTAFHARYGHARPATSFVLDGFPLGARCAAARTAHRANRLHPRIVALFEQVPGWSWTIKMSAAQRSSVEWIELVEHFVVKTGIRTVHRSAWVSAPDSGARANIGEWIHTKARRRNFLTELEKERLDAALGM